MIIYEAAGKITAQDDKSNLNHFFDVSDETEALKIQFSYSPKVLEDRHAAAEEIKNCFRRYSEEMTGLPEDYFPVNNLVTVSLDDPERYRGCAHRQDCRQEHVISGSFASPGFVRGEIPSGTWSLTLNVHCALCDIDYHILVTGEGKK